MRHWAVIVDAACALVRAVVWCWDVATWPPRALCALVRRQRDRREARVLRQMVELLDGVHNRPERVGGWRADASHLDPRHPVP